MAQTCRQLATPNSKKGPGWTPLDRDGPHFVWWRRTLTSRKKPLCRPPCKPSPPTLPTSPLSPPTPPLVPLLLFLASPSTLPTPPPVLLVTLAASLCPTMLRV